MSKIYNICTKIVDFIDMALPPIDQRHQYLRFEGLQYTDADIADFETRLAKIYRREVHRVQVFDFEGLTEVIDGGLRGRMLMEHRDAQGQSGARRRMSWRQFILALGLHIAEEIEIARFGLYRIESGSSPIASLRGVRYLRLFTSGRKQGAMKSGGQFVARLAEHYRLLTEERLQGLTVIDMAELPIAAAGAPEAAEDAPVADEGAPAVPAPVQMMSQAGVRYTSYAEFQIPYERRTRCRTDGASTSTAQQDEQQPDP
ncbi:hypothetical protein Tco_1347623 [Tanacetum coccineum]